ncbi:MAG: RNA-binding S4 domain-containing protein [Ardenticatenales bacterium]
MSAGPGGEAAADVRPTVIRLGAFLKYAGLAGSGGEAKVAITAGDVLVNGAVETRRRRQLKNGDVVTVGGEAVVVDMSEPAAGP